MAKTGAQRAQEELQQPRAIVDATGTSRSADCTLGSEMHDGGRQRTHNNTLLVEQAQMEALVARQKHNERRREGRH